MNRLFWILGLVLLVGTLVGAGLAFNSQPTASLNSSSTAEPKSLIALGFVDGEHGVTKLYPLMGGRVVKALAEDTKVAKGDPVLWLDDELARHKLEEAQADLKSSLALLERAKLLEPQHKLKITQQQAAIASIALKRKSAKNELDSKLEAAKQGIDINKNLLQSMEQTVQQFDELGKAEQAKLDELKLIDTNIDIRRAEADVAAKKAQAAAAQWALDQTKLYAPSDGLVLRNHVSQGEVLGGSATRPAIEFLPKGDLIVRAELLQEWANRVKLDQAVDIADDTYDGQKWKGKVYFLSPWFAQKRNVIIEPFMYNDVRYRECLVRVAPEGEGPPLRVGQRVRVRIKE